MERLRAYGKAPYCIVAVHGGPGAPGEMATVARTLARRTGDGVLEPLQAAKSVSGQIDELEEVIVTGADPPVTLLGYSWGAWLSYLTAARVSDTVRKLILVSSGPFLPRYAAQVHNTRFARLSPADRARLVALSRTLVDPAASGLNGALRELALILARADACDPLEGSIERAVNEELVDVDAAVYDGVWPEADALRRSGALLAAGETITAPVVAVHGDYDPHPVAGVRGPLARVLDQFRFILLERCGHRPWIERHAREAFYRILIMELH